MMSLNPPRASSLYSNTSSSLSTDTSLDLSIDTSTHSFVFVDRNVRPSASQNNMAETLRGTEDVNAVMAQVLHRMGRIVDHLRDQGENDAANSIARDIVNAITVFNETTAPWDIAKMSMSLPASSSSDPSPADATSNWHVTTNGSQKPFATSWAAIAAVAPAAGNKLIKFTPSDTVQVMVKEVEPESLVPDADSDKRVVWIRGWSSDKSLSDITNKIGQGPIYSMAYSEKDSAVCVIFQHTQSALSLCADDAQYVKSNGHSRFGPGCDIVPGLPFPDNDDMHRMSMPFNERRRLTLARSQLFTQGMTEEKFKRDVYSIVGEKNVELIWLFNTGNATVVTSAVPLARLVRNEFIRISKTPGSPYRGVVITFSHDPCEKPMTLITQMFTSRSHGPVGTYGRNGVAPTGIVAKNGTSGRRNAVSDSDGWQTVSRKR